MPAISIIVPVYNVEKFLHRCVDSILSQSFTDFELILVDDESPDNCPAICDDYSKKDSRVIVIHQKNTGVSGARNAGIEAANGEYLYFCDSDDYLSIDYVGKLYLKICSEKADMVSAGYTAFDEEGVQLYSRSQVEGDYYLETLDDRYNFIAKKVLLSGIGWEVYTKLFKHSLINKYRIRFCETCGNFAEDMGFVIEYLLICSKVNVIEEKDYYYIKRNGSMMAVSRTVVKLNSMNEISKHFGKVFLQMDIDNKKQKMALIHYLIMRNQYQKIVLTDRYSELPVEIKQIKDQHWYRKWTKTAFLAKKVFYEFFDKARGKKILLLSSYCLHNNWKIHSYISAVFYRYLY